MANVQGIHYPRGFIIPMVDGGLIRNPGNPDVERLYDLLIGNLANVNGWSYRRLVFPTAMAVFGDFATFLSTQKLNPFLYGYNYEFLIDTLRFIETGRRRISVQNWFDLLLENHEPNNDWRTRSNAELESFTRKYRSDTAAVVSRWVSHDGGFNDLVVSMHILFGVAKVPLEGL